MQKSVVKGASAPGHQIRTYYPAFAPAVIFDVGANLGQSSRAFAIDFPDAAIYAFEPASASYQRLAANMKDLRQVQVFNLALGRRSGHAQITKRRTSPSNRIIESPNLIERRGTETVPMASGDAFCAQHGLTHIDFLKVDAEGSDLDVLIGFQRMLSSGAVDFVETEVGMNRHNRRHVPFEAVKAFLEPIGYHLFRIHDLAMDTPFTGRTVLRRVNTIFVSDPFVEAHRQDPKKTAKRKADKTVTR